MARRTQTYAIRLAIEGGGQVRAELVSVGQSGEQTFGNHRGLVGFHLATIAIYGVLLIRARPRSLGS
jgi:hypothetical protein